MSEERLGWHFIKNDGRLAYADGRKVVCNEWMEMKPVIHQDAFGGCMDTFPDPILCRSGMHASETIRGALNYAHGKPILCRVKVRGCIQTSNWAGNVDDKFCGRERIVLKVGHVLVPMYEFAMKVLQPFIDRAIGSDSNISAMKEALLFKKERSIGLFRWKLRDLALASFIRVLDNRDEMAMASWACDLLNSNIAVSSCEIEKMLLSAIEGWLS